MQRDPLTRAGSVRAGNKEQQGARKTLHGTEQCLSPRGKSGTVTYPDGNVWSHWHTPLGQNRRMGVTVSLLWTEDG